MKDRLSLNYHTQLCAVIGNPISHSISYRSSTRSMFPADLLHALLRHSMAAHKRKTIAFGRRSKAIVEGLFVFVIWRNFVKGVSERRGDPTTPAMRLGLTDRPCKWERVLGRRLFPDREKLGGTWLELYRRDGTTPEQAQPVETGPFLIDATNIDAVEAEIKAIDERMVARFSP